MENGWLIKQLWIISHSYHWSPGTLVAWQPIRGPDDGWWPMRGLGGVFLSVVSVCQRWHNIPDPRWPPDHQLSSSPPSAWPGEITAHDSLLVWVCWFSVGKTFPEKIHSQSQLLSLSIEPSSEICSVTVINIGMMTTIHQCQVWVFSQNKTTYYSDQLHSYHCDDLTNWFLGNFFIRLKFCSHLQWSSDFSPDEIYNETTGFCKIDGSGVEIGSSSSSESTFLNHETIEKSLEPFRLLLHPFVVSQSPSLCAWLSWRLSVLYDNDRPGQDDLDDDDRDEGQCDEEGAQGDVRVWQYEGITKHIIHHTQDNVGALRDGGNLCLYSIQAFVVAEVQRDMKPQPSAWWCTIVLIVLICWYA